MGEPPDLTMCGLRCVVQDKVGEHFILTGVSYLILEYAAVAYQVFSAADFAG
jgi:hypothetical protein